MPPGRKQSRGARSCGSAAKHENVGEIRNGPYYDGAPVLNLVENAGGIHGLINTANSLPDKLRAIAERLGFDHQLMVDRYEVDFTGDARLPQPFVNVGVTREGVRVEMSARRPF